MIHQNLHPETVFDSWNWRDISPYFDRLAKQPLNQHNLADWLLEWTNGHNLLEEAQNHCYVATTRNTEDRSAREKYQRYLEEIFPESEQADQRLKERLLESGYTLPGLEVPLRNLGAEASIYCQENLSLLSREKALITQYDEVLSTQTVKWKGEELTIQQMQTVLQSPDRNEREAAWRLASERQLEDRQQINELWTEFFTVREKMALNKGMADYRAYRWLQLVRLDYSVEDCLHFHAAVEKVVLPAAQRVCDRRRRAMGVPSLRPWDIQADPLGRPPLQPFQNIDELRDGCGRMLQQVHPQLGEYFSLLVERELLDLDNRKGKAPGGYCIEFPYSKIPFIFMNAVGIHEDVLTLVHESGHAFHALEQFKLPYHLQYARNLEFMEVASTTMEYLCSPYLTRENGGFYTTQEAARAVAERLENFLLFLPYLTVVDAFQHWAYEHPDLAVNPAECDIAWAALWNKYMIHEDWNGLEEEMKTGWQRKLHIHEDPFYYIEYGLAELGAIQIWMNSLENPDQAIRDYLKALSLGSTANVIQLYQAAGTKLIWEVESLSPVIAFVEEKINQLNGTAVG